jgi:hypothetical protein
MNAEFVAWFVECVCVCVVVVIDVGCVHPDTTECQVIHHPSLPRSCTCCRAHVPACWRSVLVSGWVAVVDLAGWTLVKCARTCT